MNRKAVSRMKKKNQKVLVKQFIIHDDLIWEGVNSINGEYVLRKIILVF